MRGDKASWVNEGGQSTEYPPFSFFLTPVDGEGHQKNKKIRFDWIP